MTFNPIQKQMKCLHQTLIHHDMRDHPYPHNNPDNHQRWREGTTGIHKNFLCEKTKRILRLFIIASKGICSKAISPNDALENAI